MEEKIDNTKRDCFAYKSDNFYSGCDALNNLFCRKGECSFYINKEKKEEKEYARLNANVKFFDNRKQ